MQILLTLLGFALSNLRTLPGAASAASAVTAGVVTAGSSAPMGTNDWIILACGAVGVVAQFVQARLSAPIATRTGE